MNIFDNGFVIEVGRKMQPSGADFLQTIEPVTGDRLDIQCAGIFRQKLPRSVESVDVKARS